MRWTTFLLAFLGFCLAIVAVAFDDILVFFAPSRFSLELYDADFTRLIVFDCHGTLLGDVSRAHYQILDHGDRPCNCEVLTCTAQMHVLVAQRSGFHGASELNVKFGVRLHLKLKAIRACIGCRNWWVMRYLLTNVLELRADILIRLTKDWIERLTRSLCLHRVLGHAETRNMHQAMF